MDRQASKIEIVESSNSEKKKPDPNVIFDTGFFLLR